ncbi:MAG: 2-keto-4-pentenoate hydratase [Archaeoglobi archaeon]|nr:2-keto-4-pentenoate hydratase [Archaeoglobi archaeon]MDK2781359.1 2-keto-4-pentenoate hydratase [Archaeoglobi archaeon]
MDENLIKSLALELLRAEDEAKPVEPLSERYPEITIEDAYRIQLEIVRKKVERGERVIGKKIGLTSRAMMDMLNVDQPDYGHITDRMLVIENEPIDTSKLIAPKVEAEIAFLLKEDLEGPGVSSARVLQATEGVFPALEIIDSRIKDWRIKIFDTVADNAGIARLVLGGRMVRVDDLDLRLVGLVMRKNGEIVATAAGASVLGNPADSVAWLANKLSEFGVSLKKGEIILSGSLIRAFDIKPGESVIAEFDRLGSVSARFV